MFFTWSKSTLNSLSKRLKNDLVRQTSRLQSDDVHKSNGISPPSLKKRPTSLRKGNNSVLICSVFDANVRRCLQNFEHKFNIPVKGATYFERNTGLGQKPCLLLHLKDPIPWHDRIMHYGDVDDVAGKTGKRRAQIRCEKVINKQLTPMMLYQCKNLSNQILCLYNNTVMSPKVHEFHAFIIAMLEDCLHNVQPDVFKGSLHAFGSSPCGLASQGSSDLDLTYIEEGLDLERDTQKQLLRKAGSCFAKAGAFSRVQYILRATVPIIRFQEKRTFLGVDLSASMGEGVRFADLFCDLREYDDRIFPLIVAIRFWSRINNLTCINFSNFVQTSLLIFYLQQVNVIPPLKYFIAGDVKLLKDDPKVKLLHNTDRETIGDLLTGFFQFYLKFDFLQGDLNLFDGTSDTPAHSRTHKFPMFMENPFYPYCANRNIGKNVTLERVTEFKELCHLSLAQLDSRSRNTGSREPWGLSCILPCDRPSLLDDM